MPDLLQSCNPFNTGLVMNERQTGKKFSDPIAENGTTSFFNISKNNFVP
jgi:hypothetical protein